MNERIKKLLATLYLIMIPGVLLPQIYNVEQYTELNGLAENNVKSMLQDENGRMWFASEGNITVYDGIKWTTFPKKEVIENGEIFKVTKDPQKNIYAVFGTGEIGISKFENGIWKKENTGIIRTRNYVNDFIVDTIKGQRVVIITEVGTGLLIGFNNAWKKISFPEGGTNEILSVTRYKDRFLVSTEDGLYYVTEKGETRETDITVPSKVMGLYFDRTGDKLYLAGETWIGFIENGELKVLSEKLTGTFTTKAPGLQIIPDKERGLIIGNEFTLLYYSFIDNGVSTLGLFNGLIADGMISGLLDRENNIWISCSRGVSKISSRRFKNFVNVFMNYEREVSSILEYEPGNILLAGNFGVSFYNGTSFERISILESPDEPRGFTRVLDMCKDESGNVWAACNTKGLWRIYKDGRKENITRKHNLTEQVTSVLYDNGKLWFSSTTKIYTYENNKIQEIKLNLENEPSVRKIFRGKDGTIYFAVIEDGIIALKGKTIRHIGKNSPKQEKNTYAVFEHENGKVLVGTTGGLFEISGDSLIKTSVDGFTLDKPIFLIIKDRKNRLWFGTNNGIYRVDGKTTRFYSPKEGLAGNEVNRSAGIVDAAGRVWIGTNHGASCYYEEYDDSPDKIPPPETKITGIISGKVIYAANEKIELGPDENTFNVKFIGVSLIKEKENRLRYKLEGYNKDWITITGIYSDELIFADIPAGDYSVSLQMSNSYGIWGPVSSSPQITINKPYNQRWWFYSLMLITLVITLFYVQKYISQKRYNRYLKSEIDKATKELTETETKYREALLQEVHHRVKNNLQIISSLLSLQGQSIDDKKTRSLLKESEGRIHTMALIHEKLYKAKKLTTINVSEYIKEIVDHLRRSYLTDTSQIKIEYKIPQVEINSDTATTIGLIINELVTNSFKHAFPENNKGKILISLNRPGDGQLHLKVSDNGTGLKEVYDKNSANTLGLKVVEILSRQHKGSFNIYNDNGVTTEATIKENH
jgi:two-component sensor histidine kinase/ligand-binding sensor domain-containing protein